MAENDRTLKDIQEYEFRKVNGLAAPDLLITGGQILNVYTGEILPGDVTVSGPLIRYVGPASADSKKTKEVIQAGGSYLIPGFFDPHAHTDILFNPASFSNQTILTGTTSVFSDSHDLATSLGPSGFKRILRDFLKYPVKFFSGVPATSPPFPGIEGTELYKMVHFKDLIRDPAVLGVSEIPSWIRILDGDKDLIDRIELARRLGKRVEGHTLGASLEKLNRLVYDGITSCHEALSVEDVIKRLRLGLFVMLRHGSIRSDLKELASVFKDRPYLSMNRVMLTPDTFLPSDMMAKGYMDYLVREAVRYGIDPILAIRMVTLNPASYFGLDHLLGGIAPGRIADILLTRELNSPRPHLVIERGRVVVKDGELRIAPAPLPTVGTEGRPFRMKTVPKKWLQVHSTERSTIRVPAIQILDKTVTSRKEVSFAIRDGLIQPDGDRDLLLICMVQRDGEKIGKGFLSGFGLKGGVASSLSHDIHNLMVIGDDIEDMRIAADEVLRMGGGVALVKNKHVVRALSLPIGGIMSSLPMADLAREMEALRRAFKEMGSHLVDPFLTMSFLSFTSILDLRITVSGVYSVKEGKVIF
ncbi:MAG: amidohydrolase family protein [Proteobacteria bacterium]|nr:amidohydrolase family protein [Pseudomonadota bacterium]NIS71344.1 amidohydrolase family protein [Pseudomonadota bacterium]